MSESYIRRVAGNLLSMLQRTADPAAETARFLAFAKSFATRQLLATLAADSQLLAMQPFMGRQKIGIWLPPGGPTNANGIGMSVPQNSGTGAATARVPDSTNMLSSLRRLGFVSSTSTSAIASTRSQQLQFWRGNAAGLGGFCVILRFAISDAVLVTTANMLVGLQATANAQAAGAMSGNANILGVGCDSGDTNLQLYAAGVAAQARTSLGANFPVNTTNVDVYELILYALPNGSDIRYVVNRLNTGDTTSGTISAAAALFANTQFLAINFQRENGATAAAVGIDMISAYADTNI